MDKLGYLWSPLSQNVAIYQGIHLRVLPNTYDTQGHSYCRRSRSQKIYSFLFSPKLSKNDMHTQTTWYIDTHHTIYGASENWLNKKICKFPRQAKSPPLYVLTSRFILVDSILINYMFSNKYWNIPSFYDFSTDCFALF